MCGEISLLWNAIKCKEAAALSPLSTTYVTVF